MPRIRSFGVRGAVLVLATSTVIFCVDACSHDETANTPGTIRIGPAGGTLTSDDGLLRVVIPKDALRSDAAFSIKASTAAPPGAVSKAYEIGPSGTHFALPVTLEFGGVAAPQAAEPRYVATSVGGAWTPVGPSVSDDKGHVTAWTTHLSLFVAKSEPPPPASVPACSCNVACLVGACTAVGGSVVGEPTPDYCGCVGGDNDVFANDYVFADDYEACSKTQTSWCTPAIRDCCQKAEGRFQGGNGWCACTTTSIWDPSACFETAIRDGQDRPRDICTLTPPGGWDGGTPSDAGSDAGDDGGAQVVDGGDGGDAGGDAGDGGAPSCTPLAFGCGAAELCCPEGCRACGQDCWPPNTECTGGGVCMEPVPGCTFCETGPKPAWYTCWP